MGPDRDMRISPSGGGDIAGIQIGQYRVVARLGAGGMGEVYRARDTKLDRDVAIKILPARVCRDRERRARFLREARLLATLNHPTSAASTIWKTWGMRVRWCSSTSRAPRSRNVWPGLLSVREALAVASRSRTRSVRPSQADRASRPEAIECRAPGLVRRDLGRSACEDSRLRDRQARRGTGAGLRSRDGGRQDESRTGPRHALLHESRAGSRRPRRQADRHLVVRLLAVRDAGCPSAIW